MVELQAAFVELVRVTLLLTLPLLVALFVAGLASSLIQTFTLVSEPVIGLTIKLLALAMTLYLMLPSFSRTMIDFTTRLYGRGS